MKSPHSYRAFRIAIILFVGVFAVACGENDSQNPSDSPDSQQDEVIINPKTIVLDASRTDQIVEFNDEYMIVKDLTLGTPLSSGTRASGFVEAKDDYYFICTATDQIPDGAFKKIKSITPMGGQYKVTFDPLARFGLQDVIENGSCHQRIPHADIESITDDDGKRIEFNGHKFQLRVDNKVIPGDEHVKFAIVVTVDLDYSPDVQFEFKDGTPYLGFGVTVTPDCKVETDFSIKYKKTLVDQDDLLKILEKTVHVKFSKITIPIGVVPVIVQPEAEITFGVSLSGDVHVKGTLFHWKPSYSAGMEGPLSKDGDKAPDIKPYYEKNPPEVKATLFENVRLNVEGTLKENIEIKSKLKVYGTLTGTVGFDLYAKQKLSMGGEYNPSTDEISALPMEVKPSAGVDGIIEGSFKLFKWNPGFQASWTILETDFDPWIITDFKSAPVVVTIDGAIASGNSILISGAALVDETQDETKIEECGFEYYTSSPNQVTRVISSMDGSTYFHEQVGLMKKFTSTMEDLQPNTTFYVRAFASNSKGTRFGKIVEVKTTSSIPLPSSLTLKPGDQVVVDLPNGPGEYSVNSSDTKVARASIDNSTLIIKSIDYGLTTILVKDNRIGASVEIVVTVSDSPQRYNLCPDDHHPHAVDLGLPSGTKWACCNVGANKPEDFGDYFAWGETSGYNSGKKHFSWSTYKYCMGTSTTLTKYCHNSHFQTFDVYPGYNGFTDNLKELELEDDAAYKNWGAGWRMFSGSQMVELFNNCTWTWTNQNGINGYLVSGSNGNVLFIPASGYYEDDSLNGAMRSSNYWSRTICNDFAYMAQRFYFFPNQANPANTYRYVGSPVRPVLSE